MIFFILAAACNACMDTLVHHFGISVFQKLNPQFWWPEISWRNKYILHNPDLGHKKWVWDPVSDGWHIFKSLMIVFVCLSIATFNPVWKYDFPSWLKIILTVSIYGLFWNSAFNLFYNHLLIRKK